MKKLLLFGFAAAAMLLTSACSKDFDPVDPVTGEEGVVTFSLQLPDGAVTRAMGDGLSATYLYYVIWDKNGKVIYNANSYKGSWLSTTLSLKLVKGMEYDAAFFAYNNGSSPYTFDLEAKTVTFDYSSMNTTRDYDCFYKAEHIVVDGQTGSYEVVLTRPVSQINWGTSDFNESAVQQAYTYYYSWGEEEESYFYFASQFAGKACKTLDLLTGEARDEVDVVWGRSRMSPLTSESFPVGDGAYTYLNRAWILVPDNRSDLVNVSLKCFDNVGETITIDVPNVPVERNYRTNIYGALLTNSIDIKVSKDADWGVKDINKEIWNGEIVKPTEKDGVYNISSSAELAGIAQLVNGGSNLSGKTVNLLCDLDFNKVPWTAIGTPAHPFQGTFNGNGYTINNMVVNLNDGAMDAGLFGYINSPAKISNVNVTNVTINTLNARPSVRGAGVIVGTGKNSSIDNVHVKNATIDTYRWTGGVIGYAYTSVTNSSVENVVINLHPEWLEADGEWDNQDKGGALIGAHFGEGAFKIENNTVKNCSVSGYRHIGGMIGYVNYNANMTISGNTIENVTVSQSLEHNYKNIQPGDLMGELAYITNATATYPDNTITNVKLVPGVSTVSDAASLTAAFSTGGIIPVAEYSNITCAEDLVIDGEAVTLIIPESASIEFGDNSMLVNKTDLTLSGKGTISGSKYVISNDGGTLTIDGGNFRTTGDRNGYQFFQTVRCEEGTLIINDGYFEATDGAVVLTNFVNGSTGQLIINGGTFVNTNSGNYALCMNGNGDFEINGGTFVGYFGCARAENGARAVINGGDFLCNGTGNTYYALCVNAESYGDSSTVTVNGGNFWSTNATLSCRDNSTLNLQGGKYKALGSYEPATGYTATEINETKSYTIDGMNIDATFNYVIAR